MPQSLAISFLGKEGGVKLNPTKAVADHLAEMQLAVVNTATRLGKKSNIDILQGTLLVEKLKTGLLLDQRSAQAAADSAGLRTAFYLDQREAFLPVGRPEKIVNYSLVPEFFSERSFTLRGNFRFRDGSSSEYVGQL